MIILAELWIKRRAAIAAKAGAARRDRAGGDVEDRQVATGLGVGAVRAAATEKYRRLRNDLQAVRMAAGEFVQLHELAVLGVGLRENAFARVRAQHRNGGIEHAAGRVKRRAFQVFCRLRDRDLGDNLVAGLGRDQAEERWLVVGIGDD